MDTPSPDSTKINPAPHGQTQALAIVIASLVLAAIALFSIIRLVANDVVVSTRVWTLATLLLLIAAAITATIYKWTTITENNREGSRGALYAAAALLLTGLVSLIGIWILA